MSTSNRTENDSKTSTTNIPIIIDTGASHSFIPQSLAERLNLTQTHETNTIILGDGTTERSEGTCTANIQVQERTLPWTFITLASLNTIIVGTDFLRAHHIDIDHTDDTTALQLQHRDIAPQRQP
jgi:predicted aspartyl protease